MYFMLTIDVDFETRSLIDLKMFGVYKYLEHPTTDVWCMAYAINDAEPSVWFVGEPVPAIFEQTTPVYRSWNAMFERLVWREIMVKRYGFPELPLDAWHCTAAEAANMGLPRRLEKGAEVLRLPEQKDMEGSKLAQKMSRPRKIHPDGSITWWDDPVLLAELAQYCKQDVVVERAIAKCVKRLTPVEREIYLLNQRLNDRGIRVDMDLVKASQKIVAEGKRRAEAELSVVTSGAVTEVTQVAGLAKFTGLESVDKAHVRDALAAPAGLTPEQVRALELRAEAGRSSVAKLDVFERVTCNDGRVRGLLLYFGAQGNGRDSGKLIQPQNFPRPDEGLKPEDFLHDVLDGAYDRIDLFHPPIAVIAGLLRGCLVASEGKVLRVGDFAQVEARVLAWLAGQDDLVALFASGGKVYEEMAAAIYKVPVETIKKGSVERQRGKDTVLACGYQMGAKKYRDQIMEKSGIDVGEEFAKKAVDGYRARFPRIVDFWSDCSRAAIQAVKEPGKTVIVGGNKFRKSGGYLLIQLRSGRVLHYPRPKIEEKDMPWGTVEGVTCEGEDSYTHQWVRYSLYGGHITENIVSATSRDLMWGAGLRLDRTGYDVLLTVHDEVVTEVDPFHSELSQFENIMAAVPKWAAGCPIAVEAYQSARYRK